MVGMIKITGVSNVIGRLIKTTQVYERDVPRKLGKGGAYLQRESMKICPVDKNNLKPGAFTRNIGGGGFKTDVIVGYVAEYAVYVHENMEARHKAGTESKFLEKPAKEKRKEILEIIAKG